MLKILSNKIRRYNPYDYKYQFIKNTEYESVKVLVDDSEIEITLTTRVHLFDQIS